MNTTNYEGNIKYQFHEQLANRIGSAIYNSIRNHKPRRVRFIIKYGRLLHKKSLQKTVWGNL